jgi:hypothetical protein
MSTNIESILCKTAFIALMLPVLFLLAAPAIQMAVEVYREATK